MWMEIIYGHLDVVSTDWVAEISQFVLTDPVIFNNE